MKWFDKLERKYGRYAIKNLMNYIIILYALGFVINMFWPEVYSAYFSLNAQAILQGQVWRIFTFIIQPTSTSLIFVFFSLYLYYMIGNVLERVWGSFKFNIYFFMGVILHVLAAIIVYLIFGINLNLNTYYLNLALFMAFAMVNPDMQVMLFFIIPIKIKWIAYLDALFFAVKIIGGFLVPWMPQNIWLGLYMTGLLSSSAYACYVQATAALVSMLNFLVFFSISRLSKRKTKTQKNFRRAMNNNNSRGGNAAGDRNSGSINQGYNNPYNQNRGNSGGNGSGRGDSDSSRGVFRGSKIAKHRCAVCGKTEYDSDDLEFRFCSKCEGNYEYCKDHLYTHVHVTNVNKNQNNNNVTKF